MTDLNFIHLEAKDIKKAIEALKKNGVGQNGCQVVLDANKVYQIMLENERLRRKPDPITGLVPCGCGGKAKIWPSDPTQFTKVVTDYEAGCTECAMTTGFVRGKKENAVKVWNTAMGWREKE